MRSTRTSKHPARWILDAGLLIAIAAILALDFNAYRWLMPVDEGQWLFYANQLLEGRRLYVDVWYQFGPAVLYGLCGAMLVAGKTVATERIYFWLLNAAGLAVLYAFSGTLHKRATPRLTLCLIVLVNALTCRLVMANPGFLLRQCFNLLPLLLLFGGRGGDASDRGGDAERASARAFAAGLLGMLSVLVSQETGLFACVACVVFLLAAGLGGDGSKRSSLASLARFGAGFGLGLLLWSGFCLSQGSLRDYFVVGFGEVFLMASTHQSVPFPTWESLAGPAFDSAAWLHFSLSYLPLIASAATGSWLLATRSRNARLLALSAYGVCSFAILIGRSDLYHSTFAALPLFLLASYGLEATTSLAVPARRHAARLAIGAVSVLILLANSTNLAKLFERSRFAKSIEYAEPLPRLGSALIPEWQHETIRFVKREVEANSRPDESIFVILHAPELYFFVDRPTRTRYATPIFANHASAQAEILEDIRSGAYAFVIHDRTEFPDIDYRFYFTELFAHLREHYVLQSELPRRVRILKRREPSTQPAPP